MQTTMAFTQDKDVLSATAMQVVLLICSVTGMECVLVKIAPLAQNVTCAVKTSSILRQRDASKCL